MSSTRECSSVQENRIANKLEGFANSSSGSGRFNKSDVNIPSANMIIECKTCMSPKSSFSIKKDWLDKLKQEAFSMDRENFALAFNFNYEDKDDYFIINDRLMKYLVKKLEEDN